MTCPRCGNATQQGPNGSWICPNCGWGTGFVPTEAVQWLEAQPIAAFWDAGHMRLARLDDDGDFRGGSIRGLYSVKADHGSMMPHSYCVSCSIARSNGTLVVVG